MSKDGSLKQGKFSLEDMTFVLQNRNKLTVLELARKVQRKPTFIQRFLKENPALGYNGNNDDNSLAKNDGPDLSQKAAIRHELRETEEFKRLKQEFDTDERKLFEEKFIGLVSQFNNEVRSSEETQIMQACKFEILMSRNLIARKVLLGDMARLRKTQSDFLAKFEGDVTKMSDEEREYTVNLQNQLEQMASAESNKTSEYVKLQGEHGILMKNLKATRDQRIKEIESGKVSMIALIKSLQNKDVQERTGRENELMKLSIEKEYKRLGQLHTFENGEIDRPILSSETVDQDEETLTEDLE